MKRIPTSSSLYLHLGTMKRVSLKNVFEWLGVATAIIYSLLVASNTGLEFLGFSLLLLSSALIGVWAYMGKHQGILLLQVFYATAGVIGMIRWQ
jgi:hypothetical protein